MPEDKDYLWIYFKYNTEPNLQNNYKDVHKNDKEGTFLYVMLVIFSRMLLIGGDQSLQSVFTPVSIENKETHTETRMFDL